MVPRNLCHYEYLFFEDAQQVDLTFGLLNLDT